MYACKPYGNYAWQPRDEHARGLDLYKYWAGLNIQPFQFNAKLKQIVLQISW
jgi:hypothetical protein